MDLEEDNYGIPVVKWNRKPSERCKLKGPLRVVRMCLLAVLLPGILIAGPLYLRYRVYSEQLVPLGMSDQRLVDHKISTTWCQRQLVSSNATFNAYLLPQKPMLQPEPKYVNMMREIVLEDDMKEYWGFYLLKGSTVTVATCCRRPGATLIVIKGHHHLRHCAYIGDDSSEEEEELEELRQKHQDQEQYSIPTKLQRARSEVLFHGNHSGIDRQQYLVKKELDLNERGDVFDQSLIEEHFAKTRPTKVNKELETENAEASKTSLGSEEVFKAVIKKLKIYQGEGKQVFLDKMKKIGINKADLSLMKELVENEPEEKKPHQDQTVQSTNQLEGRIRRHIQIKHAIRGQLNRHDADKDLAEEEGVEHQEVRGTLNGTSANDTSNSEFWSSFSSSEERLLECDGLILSQPLLPSPLCHRKSSSEQMEHVCSQQKISYTVPGNGYYFFVFSSENEIQPNYIRAYFQLEKMQYNVSNAVAVCKNSTGDCSLPLNFFSHERLVLELPVNDSLWNTEFLVVSSCEPRTALYIACIIAVPVLILLCAF